MRKQNQPIRYPRTVRPDRNTLITSALAGKTYPAGFIPLLPEDQLGSTNIRFNIQMEETARVLANAVHVRAHAYFVSLAALPRFGGSMDAVADAWAGKAGAPAVAEYEAFITANHNDFYQQMGIHHQDGMLLNTAYVEAYNRVVNYRREQVSISLPQRTDTDHSMARALWGSTAIQNIVPTFDAALEQGSVPLQILDAGIPVSGLGTLSGGNANQLTNQSMRETDGGTRPYPHSVKGYDNGNVWQMEVDASGHPMVFAEMQQSNVALTLASLESAKQTQAFARMREKFAGNEDEMIDLLMRGLRIPSAMYRDPIHLGSTTGVFGIEQRYATDAANLETYVTNGMANIGMTVRMPSQPTGGVVVITYEIVPDPVFDRKEDLFLSATVDSYPNALRDTLDPQKVDIVPNRYIDALHTSPDATFGYAPMNYSWAREHVRLGGRFYRPLGFNPSDEDQQNIWGVTKVDPVLNEDAFLMPTDFSHHVFKDTQADPFKVICNWDARIQGITQFGPALYEASGDYDAVAAEIDDTLIDPSAP